MWNGLSGLGDGGEVVGGALEDGDLALKAAKLFVGERWGCIRRWCLCERCVLFERGGDGVETLGVVVDGCGEFWRCVGLGGDFRESGERCDGLSEAAQVGGEGESRAVEALSTCAFRVKWDGVLEQSVVESLFGVVGGEAAETACGSE